MERRESVGRLRLHRLARHFAAVTRGAAADLIPAAELPTIEFSPRARAVLGCIQIPTDYVLEKEGPRMLEEVPGVEMRLQKIEFDNDKLEAETFQRAATNIQRAVATLLPHDRCTVLGMACTSLSFTLGPDLVDAQLRAPYPAVKTTDMARAQAAAIAALGVKRVALLTPYILKLADRNAAMLESSCGVRVVSRATMGLPRDEDTTAVAPATIIDWAVAVDCPSAEAVVVGCSAFRSTEYGFLDSLEKRLGKPVVSSTQAFMWSMLRTAGVQDQIEGYGKLLAQH